MSDRTLGCMHTLADDDIAAGLSCAGEVLERDVWYAVDGAQDALERVFAAVADINRLGAVLQERVGTQLST